MNHDYEHTEFSKSLLAGVFAGIVATVLGLLYNAYFREIIGFSSSQIINVSSIIFILLLLVTIAGLVFYLFHHYFKYGSYIFQAAAILVTLLLIVGSLQVQRSANPIVSRNFRELLLGIICITGVCTTFIIPFLFKRDYI